MKEEARKRAKELLDKLQYIHAVGHYQGKCKYSNENKSAALIVIDEVLKVIPMYTGELNPVWMLYNEMKNQLELL